MYNQTRESVKKMMALGEKISKYSYQKFYDLVICAVVQPDAKDKTTIKDDTKEFTRKRLWKKK